MRTLGGGRYWKAAGLALAVALCAADAAAQQAVARLKQVTGNVLVSREAGLATGAEAQQLINGSRVITTANSTAIVVFDNGCEIRLKENERLEVDSGRPCALMLVQGLGPIAPAVAPIAGVVFPAVAGGGLLIDLRRSNPSGPTIPVSPN